MEEVALLAADIGAAFMMEVVYVVDSRRLTVR